MANQQKKRKRFLRRAGFVAGGVALAGAALYTEVMTSVVARRRSPATDAIISMATKRPPDDHDPIYEEWAAAFKASVTETVSVTSHDGYVLRAHWYPVEGAVRTVLCAHGWHSRWNLDFSGLGPYMHEQRCNLLLIEQRCHGESGGHLISYGIRERYDIDTWLSWLEEHHPGLPVYLAGVSMGAATVLMAAGLPIAHRVRGIIADCGYSTPEEVVKLTLKKSIGGLSAPTLAAINFNCKVKDAFALTDYSPIEAMAGNTEIPCLFIHGDADRLVPFRMSVENYYACQAPKELLIVSGAEHAMSFVVAPDAYKQKLLDFFSAHDPKTPQKSEAETLKKRRRAKGTAGETV